jgi:hypothetical protein
MRFLVDECLSRSLVNTLRQRGHDVRFMRDEARGTDDAKVLALATVDDRLLITEDRDFGLLTIRNREPAVGVIVIAVSAFGWPSPKLASHVADTLAEFGETCIGSLTTIEPGRARQRNL